MNNQRDRNMGFIIICQNAKNTEEVIIINDIRVCKIISYFNIRNTINFNKNKLIFSDIYFWMIYNIYFYRENIQGILKNIICIIYTDFILYEFSLLGGGKGIGINCLNLF